MSYNTKALLRDCLASLDRVESRSARVTVGVLDNASTDGSAEMVQTEFPHVRLVPSSRNLGFGAANVEMAATSEASHLMLLNSDTVVPTDAVDTLLAELESDPSIVVTGPRLVFPDGPVQYSSEGFPTLRVEVARALRGTKAQSLLARAWDIDAELSRFRRADLVHARAAHDTDSLWATCWLLRRRDADGEALFDPAFAMYDEDLDRCFRWRRAGRRLRYVPSVEIVHLGGASSTTLAKLRLMRRARARFYRRNHGSAVALAYVATIAALDLARRAWRLRPGELVDRAV